MLYRLFTEDLPDTIKIIHQVMKTHDIDGYTIIMAQGCWKGKSEGSVIIEIDYRGPITGDDLSFDVRVKCAAELIRFLLHQEAVMVQKIPCATVMITKPDMYQEG